MNAIKQLVLLTLLWLGLSGSGQLAAYQAINVDDAAEWLSSCHYCPQVHAPLDFAEVELSEKSEENETQHSATVAETFYIPTFLFYTTEIHSVETSSSGLPDRLFIRYHNLRN